MAIAAGETPVPIPNTVVKTASADGTWGVTPWESRSPPGFLRRPRCATRCRSGGVFRVRIRSPHHCTTPTIDGYGRRCRSTNRGGDAPQTDDRTPACRRAAPRDAPPPARRAVRRAVRSRRAKRVVERRVPPLHGVARPGRPAGAAVPDARRQGARLRAGRLLAGRRRAGRRPAGRRRVVRRGKAEGGYRASAGKKPGPPRAPGSGAVRKSGTGRPASRTRGPERTSRQGGRAEGGFGPYRKDTDDETAGRGARAPKATRPDRGGRSDRGGRPVRGRGDRSDRPERPEGPVTSVRLVVVSEIATSRPRLVHSRVLRGPVAGGGSAQSGGSGEAGHVVGRLRHRRRAVDAGAPGRGRPGGDGRLAGRNANRAFTQLMAAADAYRARP